MVARRRERLEDLGLALRSRAGIQTLVVVEDLGRVGAATNVREAVGAAGVRVRVLVNNAAFGPWGRFEENPADVCERVVQLVAATPMALCRSFVDDLASFPSSAVINVSSPAALQPVPYKAVYSAAKTALHHFSLALSEEWRQRGIYVQTLIPGPTKSELDEKGGAYPCGLTDERGSPDVVVSASLAGLSAERPVVTSTTGIYKQRLFNGLFPHRTILRTVGKMFRPPPGR